MHVPLIVWNPRLFASGRRVAQMGGLVDLNATVVELLGLRVTSPQWQGRSLFDPAHPNRAYFFSAIGDYRAGIRDGRWKYIYNATLGREMLLNLERDPQEQVDVPAAHTKLSAKKH